MAETLLPTTVVGSYPQPDWLVDRAILRGRTGAARACATRSGASPGGCWSRRRTTPRILAIRDMERAGIDIITDGEIRRESYSNRFALALEGIDADTPGQRSPAAAASRPGAARGRPDPPRRGPVEVRDVAVPARQHRPRDQDHPARPLHPVAAGGGRVLQDEEALALAYADAVAQEARDLKAAGADVIQLDEPWMQARPEAATRYGVKAINRALAGVPGPTVVHLCFGYAHTVTNKPDRLLLPAAAGRQRGRADLDRGGAAEARSRRAAGAVGQDDPARRARPRRRARWRRAEDGRRAHPRRPAPCCRPERLVPAPDCGMKYLPRERAFGKLRALAEGAAIVRRELAG